LLNTIDQVAAACAAAEPKIKQGAPTGGGGPLFASVLEQALQQEATARSVSLTAAPTGAGGLAQLPQRGSIEPMILAAAASGEAGDIEAALLMLCMTLQSEGAERELGPLMGVMASMVGQARTRSGGDEAMEGVRRTLMQADCAPAALGRVEARVFGAAQGTFLPDEAWKPTNPQICGRPGERSAERLDQVLDQFAVESAERYRAHRRTGSDTYCNIYVWDATSALGCEIPHYVDAATGAPRSYPDVAGAVELGANSLHDWLVSSGQTYGWREVSAAEAQALADQGYPAVTAWRNPNPARAGHVQMVRPSREGGYDPARGVAVAQAGARNSRYTYTSDVFGADALRAVRYFVHD